MDYFSKYIEIIYLKGTIYLSVIDKLKSTLAHFGIPEQLTTDNRPQFIAVEFK